MLPDQRQMLSTTGGAILAALIATGAGGDGAVHQSFPPTCTWEGLAKRRGGPALLSSRWEAGSLILQDEKLTWKDARDAGKNVIVPIGRVTGQLGTCDAGRPSSPCREWGFRTRRETFLFRDPLAVDGSVRLREIHDHVRALLAGPPFPATESKR